MNSKCMYGITLTYRSGHTCRFEFRTRFAWDTKQTVIKHATRLFNSDANLKVADIVDIMTNEVVMRFGETVPITCDCGCHNL